MEGQLSKKPSFQEFFVIKLGKKLSSFSYEFIFGGDFMSTVPGLVDILVT